MEPRKEGEYPCLIVNRRGNRDFGIWTKEEAFMLLAEIASWGYVVATSQYRGCAGGEGKEQFGGNDVQDVLSLIPLLESLDKADPQRIVMLEGGDHNLTDFWPEWLEIVRNWFAKPPG